VSLAQDLVVNGFVDLEQPCCFGFHMPADEIAHTDHPLFFELFCQYSGLRKTWPGIVEVKLDRPLNRLSFTGDPSQERVRPVYSLWRLIENFNLLVQQHYAGRVDFGQGPLWDLDPAFTAYKFYPEVPDFWLHQTFLQGLVHFGGRERGEFLCLAVEKFDLEEVKRLVPHLGESRSFALRRLLQNLPHPIPEELLALIWAVLPELEGKVWQALAAKLLETAMNQPAEFFCQSWLLHEPELRGKILLLLVKGDSPVVRDFLQEHEHLAEVALHLQIWRREGQGMVSLSRGPGGELSQGHEEEEGE
jgi:hypothetical protein